VLSETANESIPREIRDQFPQDDQGRVLFFTKPPIDTRRIIQGKDAAERGQPLAHSEEYLNAKAERDKLGAGQKRALQDQQESHAYKKLRPGQLGEEREADGRIKANHARAAQIKAETEKHKQEALEAERQLWLRAMGKGLLLLSEQMETATVNEYKLRYGDEWERYLHEDRSRHEERTKKEADRDQKDQELRSRFATEPVCDSNWSKASNLWTGHFKVSLL